jgi:hypothetical protein
VQVPPSDTSVIVGDSRTPRALLRRGIDIYKVKRLLGHAKLVTTERYLHLSDGDLADAVDQAFTEVSTSPCVGSPVSTASPGRALRG